MFVTTYNFSVAKKLSCLPLLTLNFVSPTIFLMLCQSFFAIFGSLCHERVEKYCDKVPLPFSLINVATEFSFVTTKFCLLISFMSQHSFFSHNISQSISLILCGDRVVRCRNNICLWLEFQLDFCCDTALRIAT